MEFISDRPAPREPIPYFDCRFNPDVLFIELRPQIAIANQVIVGVFNRNGYPAIVTSGFEGQHSKKSLHYHGRALDYRTSVQGIHEQISKAIASEIAERLGPQYDVLWKPSHIHVEYDPDRPSFFDPAPAPITA